MAEAPGNGDAIVIVEGNELAEAEVARVSAGLRRRLERCNLGHSPSQKQRSCEALSAPSENQLRLLLGRTRTLGLEFCGDLAFSIICQSAQQQRSWKHHPAPSPIVPETGDDEQRRLLRRPSGRFLVLR